jgi:large subunit ribosomal protein L5
VITRAKKAIAAFKITAGRPVGVQRDAAQGPYVRIPRSPDHGRPAARARLPRRVGQELRRPRQLRDGLKEHIVFVEIDYDKTETVWGMDIIVRPRRAPTKKPRRFSPGSACRS